MMNFDIRKRAFFNILDPGFRIVKNSYLCIMMSQIKLKSKVLITKVKIVICAVVIDSGLRVISWIDLS